MQNKFYIDPGVPDVTPIMQGIGSLIKGNREKAKAKSNADALMAAYESGDADAYAKLIASNPDLKGQVDAMMNFKSEATKKNWGDTVRSLIADPENAQEILTNRMQFTVDEGGFPNKSTRLLNLFLNDREGFDKSLMMDAAGVLNKQEMEAYKAQKGIGGDGIKQAELQLKRDVLGLRRLEHEARLLEQGLKREDNQLKRDKMQLDIDAKREKIDRVKQDIQKKAKSEIRQQSSLGAAIDDFLGNEGYVNAVTGWRGRAPALTDTGVEAEAYFDNIKNNLTLENLDKMSGVLSETDIKILSTAATAMQKGMGKKAMIKEMRKIQDVLKNKSAETQKMILGGNDIVEDQAVDEDSQAVEWAKANPNDPRSAQILQAQGAQ